MDKKTKAIVAIVAAVVILAAIAAGFYIFKTQQQLEELTAISQIEKEELEDEFMQLSIQYEGYKLNVNNDSLADKLENERIKVQRLIEELKTTKASNGRRIAELKKELSTVRGVLRTYVAQVDSLNKLNIKLKEENKAVVEKYQKITASASELKKQKEALTEKVTLASKLDAVSIKVEALTGRNRDTEKISRAEKIKLDFLITKNITAPIGEKTIYVRIMKPDNSALTKNRGDLFKYEDQEIEYSMKKLIEYTGEEQTVEMFWFIDEFLNPGEYRVDIFADGNLIGQKSFSLKK